MVATWSAFAVSSRRRQEVTFGRLRSSARRSRSAGRPTRPTRSRCRGPRRGTRADRAPGAQLLRAALGSAPDEQLVGPGLVAQSLGRPVVVPRHDVCSLENRPAPRPPWLLSHALTTKVKKSQRAKQTQREQLRIAQITIRPVPCGSDHGPPGLSDRRPGRARAHANPLVRRPSPRVAPSGHSLGPVPRHRGARCRRSHAVCGNGTATGRSRTLGSMSARRDDRLGFASILSHLGVMVAVSAVMGSSPPASPSPSRGSPGWAPVRSRRGWTPSRPTSPRSRSRSAPAAGPRRQRAGHLLRPEPGQRPSSGWRRS